MPVVALGFCRDSYTHSYAVSYKDSCSDSYPDSQTELNKHCYNLAVRFLCWDNYLTAFFSLREER